MAALRLLLSCSIAPSLMIDGVVVEKNKQLGMDDYYEAGTAARVLCPNGKEIVKDGTGFEKDNQTITGLFDEIGTNHKGVETALKHFLFTGRPTNDTIPNLFKAQVDPMIVGDNSCKEPTNWGLIQKFTGKSGGLYIGASYACDDCGYDLTDGPGTDIINDVVAFTNSNEGSVTPDKIPKTWCHNPLPGKFKVKPPFRPSNIIPQWRSTGGYYNVLFCKTSNYSVIGFAAEKPNTCYPFHIHKSYELYWTIGGNATWAAHLANGAEIPKYPKYKINNSAEVYELHKHDPLVTHEIKTSGTHTTQVYFWSMKGPDVFTNDINHYDVDTATVKFDNKSKSSCYDSSEVQWRNIGAGSRSGL